MNIKQFKNRLEIKGFKNPLTVEIIKFNEDLKENKLIIHNIELIKIYKDNTIMLKDEWNIRTDYKLNNIYDLTFENLECLKIVNW